MIFDIYFFKALAEVLVILIAVVTITWIAAKSQRGGRIIFGLILLIGFVYDLTMCSQFIATNMRQTATEKIK